MDESVFEKDGIYYKISRTKGEVSVVKNPSKYKWDIVIPPTVDYNGNHYPVTVIERNAFYDCSSLRSIDLGKVTTIGESAFYGCTSLMSIDLKNVTSIGGYAFSGCSSLLSIDLKNLTVVGDSVFNKCSSLKSIDLGKVTTIGGFAFYGCTSLNSVDFKKVESIKGNAFNNCTSLLSIDLKNVKYIGLGAFYDCTSLMSIDLKNVKSVGEWAFSGCTSLTTIDLKNVEFFDNKVFDNCFDILDIETFNNDAQPIKEDCFTNLVYKNATLYVPKGSKQRYKENKVWAQFEHIEEYPILETPTNITIQPADNSNANTSVNEEKVRTEVIFVRTTNDQICLDGVPEGEAVKVCTEDGVMVAYMVSNGDSMMIGVKPRKEYQVNVLNRTFKVHM